MYVYDIKQNRPIGGQLEWLAFISKANNGTAVKLGIQRFVDMAIAMASINFMSRSPKDHKLTFRWPWGHLLRYSPPNLDMEVYWYADRNGINNFYVKVTERSSIDLPMTLGLFIEIEPSKLGHGGLLVRWSQRNQRFLCQGNRKVINWPSNDLEAIY